MGLDGKLTLNVMIDITVTVLILQLFVVTGWTVYFYSRDWDQTFTPGSRIVVLQEQTAGAVAITVGALEALSLSSTLYGVGAKDRGWLMVAQISQFAMLSLIHVGYDNNTVRVFAGIADLLVIAGGWCAYRLQEKIQDAVLDGSLSNKSLWKCYDLPDQNATTLRLPGWVFSGILGISGIVLAATELNGFGVGRGVVALVVALFSGAAFWLQNRRVHLAAFTLNVSCYALYCTSLRVLLTMSRMSVQLWMISFILSTLVFTLQADNAQSTLCSTTTVNSTNTCSSLESRAAAASAFNYIGMIAALLLSWCHLRISERIQEAQVKDGAPLRYFCCRRQVSNPTWVLQRCLFGTFGVKAALMIVSFVLASSYVEDGVEVGMKGFHFTLGVVQLLILLMSAGSACKVSRSLLLMGQVLHGVIFAMAFIGMEQAAVTSNGLPAEASRAIVLDKDFLEQHPPSTEQLARLEATVVLTVLTVLEGLATAFLFVDMSEFVQEHRAAVRVAPAPPDTQKGKAYESVHDSEQAGAATGKELASAEV